MTAEQFHQDYRLLDRVTDGEVETYHAQAAAGAMVMVHFLHGPPDRQAALLRRVDLLKATEPRKVLARTDVDGVTTIVTRFILDFATLDEWLPPVTAAEAEASAARGPGEVTAAFERLFEAAPGAEPTQPAPAAPASPAPATTAFPAPAPPAPTTMAPAAATPVVPPVAPPPPAREPGEFTRMFAAAAPPAVPAPPDVVPQPEAPPARESAPAPVPPAQPAAREPGEFTRMFGALTGDVPAEVPQPPQPLTPPQQQPPPPQTPSPWLPPAAAPRTEPGEFTRMFGAAVPPAEDVASPPAPVTPAPSPPPAPAAVPGWSGFTSPPTTPPVPQQPAVPGEYTRMFGGPGVLPGVGPTATPPPPVGGGTGGTGTVGDNYFERLATGQPAPAPGAYPPPTAPPAAPMSAAGPSEFTRVVSAMSQVPSGPPPPPPPVYQPVPKPPKRGNTGLLIGLAVVVVATLVLVLVVALS